MKENNNEIKEDNPALLNINEDEMNEKQLLIDKILEKTTFSKYRIFIMICMIFMFIANGMEMCLFSLIILPFQNYFELNEKSILLEISSSSLFLGVAIGSGIAGYIIDFFGRIFTIKISSILMTVSHLIMSLLLYLPIFNICRCLIGLSLGIIIPILINIYGEYLPSKYRGFLLMVAWSFFGFGWLIMNILALLIMPELEKEKIQKFLLILFFFPLFASISCIFLLNDSPRNLLLSNNLNDISIATNILGDINSELLNDSEKKQLLDELKKSNKNENENEEKKNFFKEMFSSNYKKTTILILLLFFILAYNGYGISVISSLVLEILFKKENENKSEKKSTSNRSLIINQIMLSVGEVCSNIIGGFIGEWKKLGRKGTIILFIILGLIFILPSIFKSILFEIFSPISSGCTTIYVNLAMDYIVELYPTKIRDKSTSLLYMVYRVSGFLSQFISIGTFKIVYFLPYIIYVIICILSIIFTWLLPYEVAGISMDFKLEEN